MTVSQMNDLATQIRLGVQFAEALLVLACVSHIVRSFLRMRRQDLEMERKVAREKALRESWEQRHRDETVEAIIEAAKITDPDDVARLEQIEEVLLLIRRRLRAGLWRPKKRGPW